MGRWGGNWHDWQYALGARRGARRERRIGERRRTGFIWIMEYSW